MSLTKIPECIDDPDQNHSLVDLEETLDPHLELMEHITQPQ